MTEVHSEAGIIFKYIHFKTSRIYFVSLSIPWQTPLFKSHGISPCTCATKPLAKDLLCKFMGHHFCIDLSCLVLYLLVSSSFYKFILLYLPPVYNETTSLCLGSTSFSCALKNAPGRRSDKCHAHLVLFAFLNDRAVLSSLCSVPKNSCVIYFVQFHSFLFQERKSSTIHFIRILIFFYACRHGSGKM